jgi:hypothetical protein
MSEDLVEKKLLGSDGYDCDYEMQFMMDFKFG